MSLRKAGGSRRWAMGLVITLLVGFGPSGLSAPEIDVQRPVGSSIADGGADDLGILTASPVSLTYTIDNTAGTDPLTVDTPSASNFINTSGFVVAGPPPGLIESGSTGTFTIQFDIDADGALSFEMDIGNNDSGENPYDIVVSGMFDATPPSVDSIVRADSDPTNATWVDFTVTFDESVTSVDAADFVLDASGLTGTSIGAVTGGGTTWNVPVDTGAGDGTLSVDLNDDDTIEDVAGNRLGGTGVDNGDFGVGEAYTIDKTAPSIPDGLDPANGVYTNDTTPTLSWEPSDDAGGSGLRTTNTYRVVVTGTPSRDYYTPTPNPQYTPSLDEGVFKWKIYARDSAGNNSDWSGECTLTIDETPPAVTIDQAGTQADPTNSSSVVFTVAFDETINVSTFTDVDAVIGGTATTGTVTVSEIAPNDGTTFSVSVVVTGDGAVTATIPPGGVEDPAGNTNTASTSTDNAVTYDNTDPIDPTPSSSSHAVNVVSNDPTVDIEISGASDPGGSGVDGFDVAWDQNATWTTITEAKDQEETWAGGTFTAMVDGDWYFHIATVDNAGNWTSTQHLGPFPIDTDPPAVSDVTVSDTQITDADTPGTATFIVTVGFDEAMDTGVDPTLTFNPGVSTTLTLNPGQSGWTDDDTYVVKYDVADGNVDHDSVTIDVTGAQDPAGNGQADYTPEDEFEIDTQNPTVTSVAVIDALITDSDTPGDATFEVAVDFDKAMDTGVDPTLVFDPGVATTLWLNGGRSGWTDADTYEAKYDVADGGVDEDSVTIDVTGAQDPAGNGQEDYTLEHEFEIDTLNPMVIDVSVSDTLISEADVVGGPFTVTAVFSETMDTGTTPGLVFAPDVAAGGSPTLIDASVGAWSTTTETNGTFTVTYDLEDNNIDVDSVTIDVSGAKDAVGNDQQDYTPEHEFEIDTENPWIEDPPPLPHWGVSTTDGLVTDHDVERAVGFHVRTYFSEPMDTGTLPTYTFAPDVSTTLAPDGVIWSRNDFTWASYVEIDVNVDIDSVTIDVEGARDVAGNLMVDYTPVHEFEIDTLNPWVTVTGVMVSDPLITDADVDDALTFDVSVSFSEPMTTNGSADPTIAFAPDVSGTLEATVASGWFDTDTYDFSFSESDADVYVSSVTIDFERARDEHGNPMDDYTPVHEFEIDTENPEFTQFTIDGGRVDDNCEITIDFTARVEDTRGITAGTVSIISVTIPTGNATLGAYAITSQTNAGPTAVEIEGTVDVSDLTGCPARVAITVEVQDDAGNTSQASQTGGEITDETIPVINDLMFNTGATYAVRETDYSVDDCCEVRLYFSANVTDNCCMQWENVAVTVTLPTGNAVLEDIVVNRMQNGQKRVDVTGSAVVRCLTSCPARVEVRIEAVDRCGNDAISLTSVETEGRVVDEIAPIPGDDPRQDVEMDESAILDLLVKVGVDKSGTYRLLVREGSPVRIDVVANDTDNCSCVSHDPCATCGGCDAALWIYDIVDPPGGGTAAILDAERTTRGDTTSIRYAPALGFAGSDQFTYRIVDACGNLSSEATVYVEVVARSGMEDLFLTTCTEISVEFDVTVEDPWMDPDDPGAVPFEFSILTPPAHGVVSGDLTGIVYTAAGATTDDPASATVVLTYTPAAGFVGRDGMTVQCVDSFGASSKAVIDVAVVDCAEAAEPPPIAVDQGAVLSMILPPSFRSILERAWGSVLLVSVEDGLAYPGVLSATWDESAGQYILLVNTEGLTPGEYRLMIPLGSGETVELTIEVGEAE